MFGYAEIGEDGAPFLGPGDHILGFCNTADATPDPGGSHDRCDWLYWSRHEQGWRACRCDCHPTGHHANGTARDVIAATVTRQEQEMAAKTESKAKPKATPKAKAPRDCQCGCGGQTKGGRFLPGHDAKLKSALQTEYRGATTKAQRDKVAKRFDELGWGRFVPVLTDE